MKKLIGGIAALAVIIAGGLYLLWSNPGTRPNGVLIRNPESNKVARVIDGDTIEMGDGSRVRYIGIDSPEAGDCYAAQATQRNKELVEGKMVGMAAEPQDKDAYGRLLRYVYVDDGVFVNLELVKGGYARAIYIVPDVSLYPELKAAQDAARSAGLGLWGACR